jgi:hypothetical protein
MSTKGFNSGLLLAVAAIFIISSNTSAQTGEQQVTVTVRPSQTVEERVADSFKEKDLREAAEEKREAEKTAKLNANSPKTLLSNARTVFITSNTDYFEPVQLQNALLKQPAFESWQMAIIDSWTQREIANIIIEIDRPIFTFTFTYQITHRGTGVVLATGKVNAFDSNAAAPELAKRIVEEIKKARGELKEKKK